MKNDSKKKNVVLSKIYKDYSEENDSLTNGTENLITRNLNNDTDRESSNNEAAIPHKEVSYSELLSPKYRYALFI